MIVFLVFGRFGLPRGWCFGLLLILLGVGLTQPASAYSWMIKHGFSNCSSCHTDPSGGETLTGMGRAEADLLLSVGGNVPQEVADTAGFLFQPVERQQAFRAGGALRYMMIGRKAPASSALEYSQFPMQLDLYGTWSSDMLVAGGSLGVARGISGTAHVRAAQLNSSLGDGWLLLSRTHYLGWKLGTQSLLRVGRLNLPYGLRLSEHVLWVREATRTDRESDQQHGVAIAHSQGNWRGEGMVSFGNFQVFPDRFRERGVSGSLEYRLGPRGVVGFNMLAAAAREDRLTRQQSMTRQAYGLHGRFGIDSQWVVLTELSVLKQTASDPGYAGLVQVDYEPIRGFHLLATGELLDEGAKSDVAQKVPGVGQPKLGGWLSAALYLRAHMDLRFDVVARQNETPTVQIQWHVYL